MLDFFGINKKNFSIKNDEILSIHYLRGIAALLVALYHLAESKETPLALVSVSKWMASGVDVFFVISGFVIYLNYLNKNLSPLSFLIRRFIRVIPLYWIFLIMLIILNFLFPKLAFNNVSINFESVYKSLIFIPYFDIKNHEIWPILIPGWTLNYEIFFYLLFSFFLFKTKKHILISMAVIFSILLITGFLIKTNNAILLTYTNPLLLEFLSGMFLANLYFRSKFFESKSLLISISFILIGITGFMLFKDLTVRGISWGVPATLVVIGCLMIEKNNKFKYYKIPYLLGSSSYSIYLSHLFTLGLVKYIFIKLKLGYNTPLSFLFLTLFSLISIAFVGIIVHIIVEKPIIKLLLKYVYLGEKRTNKKILVDNQ